MARERAYPKQRAFLTAYAISGRITEAARVARIDRRQHTRWYKASADYRSWFDEAQEAMAQMLEDEAIRRAHEGVKRPVLYKGRPVHIGSGRKILYETEYSDQLLVMLLKRFRPQQYRENVMTEHTGSIELVERMQAARKRIFEMRKAENAGTTG
jgi:hypothetical protein